MMYCNVGTYCSYVGSYTEVHIIRHDMTYPTPYQGTIRCIILLCKRELVPTYCTDPRNYIRVTDVLTDMSCMGRGWCTP